MVLAGESPEAHDGECKIAPAASSPMPLHSIVINTYDRPETLSRCLGAVARQKGIEALEVVVVDDGSPADFKALERLWSTRLNLRWIKQRHSGRSAARNRGVRAARGERVLFLGDDVMVRPFWLETHLARGGGRPDLAVLGPYPLDARRAYPPAFRRWADPAGLDRVTDPENVGFEFFLTGNLSMDRERFLSLGGFDEGFDRYGWEDIDLGFRFARAGGRIVFDPAAKAIHEHPAMTRADLWRREFDSGVTAWRFWSKWRDPALDFMRYWGEAPRPGPAWRRRAADLAIGALERFAPASPLLDRLYERAVYSWRHAGVAEGMRLLPDGAARPGDAGQGSSPAASEI